MSPSPPSIAWINRGGPDGSWGAPAALALPVDARGLLLAEGVFETVLVQHGRPRLLAAHLARWQGSAGLLGLPAPPGEELIAPPVREAISRSGIEHGALRLNWCRGSSARGLEPIAPDAVGETLCWLQLSSAEPCFAPLTVIVSATEMRQASSLLSRCKSFGYGSALIARRQAREAGADDALLPSSAGGLCCGTSANLLVRRAHTAVGERLPARDHAPEGPRPGARCRDADQHGDVEPERRRTSAQQPGLPADPWPQRRQRPRERNAHQDRSSSG